MNFEQIYGYLPKTVWETPKNKDRKIERFACDKTTKKKTFAKHRKSNGVGRGRDGKKLYRWTTQTAVSQFHPDIAKRIIEFWSNEGDVILDPFAGRTRALISKICKRNYMGFEISTKAHHELVKNLQSQKTLDLSVDVHIKNDDSRNMKYKEKFDMVFSCPPYWILEDYNKIYGEDIKGQLSEIKEYNTFLIEYEKIIKKCYTALKHNRFAVFVVADFRRKDFFYCFHLDTINIFKKCGFSLHDIIIKTINTRISARIDQCISRRYMVKTHEYILIFKKMD